MLTETLYVLYLFLTRFFTTLEQFLNNAHQQHTSNTPNTFKLKHFSSLLITSQCYSYIILHPITPHKFNSSSLHSSITSLNPPPHSQLPNLHKNTLLKTILQLYFSPQKSLKNHLKITHFVPNHTKKFPN